MKRRFLVLALLLASAGGVPADAADYVVRIKDMTFGPAPATLKVGDTIRWQNDDILQHTATAKTGRFDLVLPPGKSATVTLQQAGKVTVFCRYHPGMTLQLTIEPLTTGQ